VRTQRAHPSEDSLKLHGLNAYADYPRLS